MIYHPGKEMPAPRDWSLEDDHSEKVEALLRPGRIEQLVNEGRSPLRVATLNGQPYYQVPPVDFNPEDIEKVFDAPGGGCLAFAYKDGSIKIGSTYTLTSEQAIDLEQRKEKKFDLLNSQ